MCVRRLKFFHCLKKMTQQINECNFKNWIIGPAQKNNHGGQFWAITAENNKNHPRIQLCSTTETLRIPFGPTSFTEGGRKNLDYSINNEHESLKDLFTEIDDWVFNYVWKNVADFFKKPPATKEALLDCYVPLLSWKNDFDPLLKTKVNDSALVFVLATDGASKKGSLEDISKGSSGCPIIQLDKIWVMGGNRFGVTAVTQALMLHPRKDREMEDIFKGAFINLSNKM